MASQPAHDGEAFHRAVADARTRVDALRLRVREAVPHADEDLVEELLTAHE